MQLGILITASISFFVLVVMFRVTKHGKGRGVKG
jgi:hypothetical protein